MVFTLFISGAYGVQGRGVHLQGLESMEKCSDLQVMKQLEHGHSSDSFRAAMEVVRRGERMIPLLLASKGNTNPVPCGALGSSDSNGAITLLPSDNKEFDEGRSLTIEVAAVYLISAIYFEEFGFADAAYLQDGLPVEFWRYNTNERVSRAWSAVECWYFEYQALGMQSLRKQGRPPLRESGLWF